MVDRQESLRLHSQILDRLFFVYFMVNENPGCCFSQEHYKWGLMIERHVDDDRWLTKLQNIDSDGQGPA